MNLQFGLIITALTLIFLALICEYIDSALGGGYGTILVPVLLILGLQNSIVVPAILFTEIWTGFSSATLHHFIGNANFYAKIDIKNGINNRILELTPDFKVSLILAGCGVFGGGIAAIFALNLPNIIIKTYIGILVIAMGFLVLLKLNWDFTWKRIWGMGFVAAFNKGLSGGGYGPLVSSGQIVVNRNPKEAVASTSLSEAIVSISALITYIIVGKSFMDLSLIVCLLIGAMSSVPFAVITVKRLPIEKLTPLIGICTILLGGITLIKTWYL